MRSDDGSNWTLERARLEKMVAETRGHSAGAEQVEDLLLMCGAFRRTRTLMSVVQLRAETFLRQN